MREHNYSHNHPEGFIGAWYAEDTTICDVLAELHQHSLNHLVQPARDIEIRGYTLLNSIYVPPPILEKYYKACLYPAITAYKEKYSACTEFVQPWRLDWPFNIQRFDPGNSYSQIHCENQGVVEEFQFRRHLAFMTYLNDVTDGGETEFLYQGVKIKPEKGLSVIWPAYWMHIHRGLPSNTQVKLMATGWYRHYSEEHKF